MGNFLVWFGFGWFCFILGFFVGWVFVIVLGFFVLLVVVVVVQFSVCFVLLWFLFQETVVSTVLVLFCFYLPRNLREQLAN